MRLAVSHRPKPEKELPVRPRIARRLMASVLLVLALTGCAADPRYKEGLSWIVYNEAEKARLDSQGFPQYNFF